MSETLYARLSRLTECPVCDADRRGLPKPRGFGVRFSCGAVFAVSSGKIITARACPEPSRREARIMTGVARS